MTETLTGRQVAQQGEQQPLFWYRPRSDGMYEGPIHNAQIEQVRRESGAWVPLYAGAAPAAQPVSQPQWQPIETAPKGKKGYSWMLLAWGPEEDQSIGYGTRADGKFYASATFYCLGQARQYQMREIEVSPTHWMPLPPAPGEAAPAAQPVNDNPYGVERPNDVADYGHDNSVSQAYQTPYYCAKCGSHMGDTDLPKNVPLRKAAICWECEEKGAPAAQPVAGWKLVPVEPTDDMLYEIQENCHILPPRGKRIWAQMLAAAPAAQPNAKQAAEAVGQEFAKVFGQAAAQAREKALDEAIGVAAITANLCLHPSEIAAAIEQLKVKP